MNAAAAALSPSNCSLSTSPRRLPDDRGVAPVVDRQAAFSDVEPEQPLLEEVVQLHELHRLVRLVATRLATFRDAADSRGVEAAQPVGVVVAALGAAPGRRTATPGRPSSPRTGRRLPRARSSRSRPWRSRSTPEVVPDLVPERAVEVAVGGELGRRAAARPPPSTRASDARRAPGSRMMLRAHQDRAAVAARERASLGRMVAVLAPRAWPKSAITS